MTVMIVLRVIDDEMLIEFYPKRRIMTLSSFGEEMIEDIRETSLLVLSVGMRLVRFQNQNLHEVFMHPDGWRGNSESTSRRNDCLSDSSDFFDKDPGRFELSFLTTPQCRKSYSEPSCQGSSYMMTLIPN